MNMTIAELKEREPIDKLSLLLDDRRMAKGWVGLGTTNNHEKISKQERMRKDAAADRLIRKTKTEKLGDLIKEGVAAHEKMEMEKVKRDKAIAEGRLIEKKKKKKTKPKAEKAAKA